MKKYAAICLLIPLSITGLFSTSYAQSGRKSVNMTQTPTSVDDSEIVKEPDYSETTPIKTRPTYTVPNYRNAGKRIIAKTQPAARPQPSINETVGDNDIVKVETNLVTIPVSVFDR